VIGYGPSGAPGGGLAELFKGFPRPLPEEQVRVPEQP
jgi:hypothetical protein